MQVATESYAVTAAGVRAAISAYAQAVDDGRRGDIAALSCADGWVDLPSAGVVVGRKALDALFRGEKPPSESRHIVTSTHITRWSADHAVAISDLVIVGAGGGEPWAFRSVGRYFDLLHRWDGGWRFHSRTLRFVDDA
jgi:SnoaL-like domain